MTVTHTYPCPVTLCLHDDFKNIENKHSWYYYFVEKPKVKKED